MVSGINLMAHQTPRTSGTSQETSLRRRYPHNHLEIPPQSHLTLNESKIADAEAWERYEPALREFTEEVCALSGSLVCVTKTIIGISWRCCIEREAATL